MQIINDTIEFLKTISLVDAIFFFAVLILMLLIITLVYFIKENNEDEYANVFDNKTLDAVSEIDVLKEIAENLENAPEEEGINLNRYEEEQEEKAIISYDELLKHKHDFALNYSEEETINDDIKVKKVDLDNLINKESKREPEVHGAFFTYEKEEAFLEALKTLQQTLN